MSKEAVVSLSELQKVRAERPLRISVEIHAAEVSLFKAMVEIHQAKSPGDFASLAISRYMRSEEANQAFDDLVNRNIPD